MLSVLIAVLGVVLLSHTKLAIAQDGCISHPLPIHVVDKIVAAADATLVQTSRNNCPPTKDQVISDSDEQKSQTCKRLEILLIAITQQLYTHEQELRNLAKQVKGDLRLLKEDSASARCEMYRDCSDVLLGGKNESGVYTIYPGGCAGAEVRVWCDMEASEGGWTQVLSRRPLDVQVNFARDWSDYKLGFGDPETEFWIGNEVLHKMTSFRPQILRVDMEDWDSNTRFAEYKLFKLDDEMNSYKLHVGQYFGDAGNTLGDHHNNMYFSTWDRDRDATATRNCAQTYSAGFWFNDCYYAGPTNPFRRKEKNSNGITWHGWYSDWTSLQKMSFKIRPVDFPLGNKVIAND